MEASELFWRSRRVALTGATGFIGHHLTTRLTHLGANVIALVRASSKSERLRARGVDCVIASLDEPEAMARAFSGCDLVFHLAGAVDFGNDWEPFQRANVEGTANVLSAARAAGVRRLVHASSIVAVGANRRPEPIDETTSWNLGGLQIPYVTTKREGEVKALAFAHCSEPAAQAREFRPSPLLAHRSEPAAQAREFRPSPLLEHRSEPAAQARGFRPSPLLALRAQSDAQPPEVVVVNPACVVGPDDYTASEFGTLCKRFWRGRIPFYFGGGNNFVDVRDVAEGMLLAAEKGQTGERYILGSENLTYSAFFSLLERVSGRRTFRIRLPNVLARFAARAIEACTHSRRPSLSRSQARLMGLYLFFDCGKARRELGYVPRPLEAALADTHRFWMAKTSRAAKTASRAA